MYDMHLPLLCVLSYVPQSLLSSKEEDVRAHCHETVAVSCFLFSFAVVHVTVYHQYTILQGCTSTTNDSGWSHSHQISAHNWTECEFVSVQEPTHVRAVGGHC